MKTREITIVLAILSITPAANAQALSGGGWNETPQSPQLKAIFEQIGQLDNQAAIALDDDKYAIAETDARKALALRPDYGTAQEALATALDAQGKEKEALQVYKAMADSGEVFPRVLLPYASLLLKNGQHAQSVAAYNKALPLLPDGTLMRANGPFPTDAPQTVAFETALHIALGLNYSERSYFAKTPHGYAALCGKALDQYQKALQLTPDSALAHLYAGDALRMMNLRPQARAAYAKAAALGNGDVRKAAQAASN